MGGGVPSRFKRFWFYLCCDLCHSVFGRLCLSLARAATSIMSIIGASCHKYHVYHWRELPKYHVYHWRELPQVSCLSLARAATSIMSIIGASCHKYHVYHWRELPQVSCLSLARAATSIMSIIGASCHKYHVYHWRELPQVSFLSRATNTCLSRQNYACRDKSDTCGSSRRLLGPGQISALVAEEMINSYNNLLLRSHEITSILVQDKFQHL